MTAVKEVLTTRHQNGTDPVIEKTELNALNELKALSYDKAFVHRQWCGVCAANCCLKVCKSLALTSETAQ
jgi:hypothetical protein